jgi:ribosomal protein S18 acetylase RimI-like enzyme
MRMPRADNGLSAAEPDKRLPFESTRSLSGVHTPLQLRLRAVAADEGTRLRALRLSALACDGEFFGSSYERELREPLSFWHRQAAASAEGSSERTFICESDDRWLGMALVRVHNADEAVLNAMWVAPTERGRGMASALCEACRDFASARKCRQLSLTVLRTNERAITAYESAGFAVASSFIFTCEDGTDLEKLVMTLPLKADDLATTSMGAAPYTAYAL